MGTKQPDVKIRHPIAFGKKDINLLFTLIQEQNTLYFMAYITFSVKNLQTG